MPTIDVPAGALEVVLRALSRHVPDREIRVMGSRAEGGSKPFSDLDLVVMGDEPLSLRARGELRDHQVIAHELLLQGAVLGRVAVVE